MATAPILRPDGIGAKAVTISDSAGIHECHRAVQNAETAGVAVGRMRRETAHIGYSSAQPIRRSCG